MPLEGLKKYAEKRNPDLNLIRLGSDDIAYTHASTGVFILNFALMGGWPENCVITLVGKQHSGKTTLAYKAIAQHQRKYDGLEGRLKKYCVFVDGERGFSPAWAAANGVDVSELTVITPTNAEEAVDYVDAALADPDVSLVVFDSIPSLVGGKELDKSAEDANAPGTVAVHANRMMRKVSRTIALAHNLGQKKTLIVINQWRDGIGSAPNMPRTMPGGKYLRHYASVEVEVYNTDKERVFSADDNDVKIAMENTHPFKIHKNRTGNSITEGEFTLSRNPDNPGYVDDVKTVVTYAQKFGLVGGAGTGWWLRDPDTETISDETRFKSKGAVVDYVAERPELKLALERRIIGLHRKKQGLSSENWW